MEPALKYPKECGGGGDFDFFSLKVYPTNFTSFISL